KSVVIEIAGLDLHDVASDIQYPRRHPVGTKTVDQIAVADLPQEAADPFRRADKDQIVELVKIPFVEQELIEHRLLLGEIDRQIGPLDVENVGDQKAERHHHERQRREQS